MAAKASEKRAYVISTSIVLVDTELKSHHSSILVLHNRKRLLTDQPVSYPLLESPVLATLGLNTNELLVMAADRFAQSIDIERLIGAYTENFDCCISLYDERIISY